MGNNSSAAENNSSKADNKEKGLGDEILQTVISELATTMSNSKAKTGIKKSTYEKKIKQLLTLQEKFQEYRKLVEEAKDERLKQMRTESLQLKNSLEENKQKFEKIDKEKKELEQNLHKKLLDHEKTVRDLKEKYNKTEQILNSERDIRMSLEKNVMEMKTLKIDIQAQTKKTEELQRELDSTRDQLIEQIKLNMQLETKIKLGNNSTSTTTDENTNVLRDTINKQMVMNKQVTEELNNTQRKLERELTNKREYLFKYATVEHLCVRLKAEKGELMNKMQTLQTEHETEMAKTKLNLEQLTKELQDLTEKLTATQKINRLQVKLKKKAQSDVSVLEEKNKTIKQLEMELQEKDKNITENLNQPKQELAETINFIKISEATRAEELKIIDLELSKTKSNYEFKLQAQLSRFNRLVYRLKMTEKRRDYFHQSWKNTEGKLKLLQICHTDIKRFCEDELKDRKKFLAEFEKIRCGAEASTSNELFLSEKIILQAQLEGNTNEISLLKQQLKMKEREIQNMRKEGEPENTTKATNIEIETIRREKLLVEKQLEGKTKEITTLKEKLKLKETELHNITCERDAENKKKVSTKIESIGGEKRFLEIQLDDKNKEIATLKEQLKLKEAEIQNRACDGNPQNKNKGIGSRSSDESYQREKMILETQLDNQTKEIASLKQQLKLKVTEIQNMASEGHSESRKMEMTKLHEEFQKTLEKFNQ